MEKLGLFTLVLGLAKPWRVSDLKFSKEAGRGCGLCVDPGRDRGKAAGRTSDRKAEEDLGIVMI